MRCSGTRDPVGPIRINSLKKCVFIWVPPFQGSGTHGVLGSHLITPTGRATVRLRSTVAVVAAVGPAVRGSKTINTLLLVPLPPIRLVRLPQEAIQPALESALSSLFEGAAFTLETTPDSSGRFGFRINCRLGC